MSKAEWKQHEWKYGNDKLTVDGWIMYGAADLYVPIPGENMFLGDSF
jgi:hypothetical protein